MISGSKCEYLAPICVWTTICLHTQNQQNIISLLPIVDWNWQIQERNAEEDFATQAPSDQNIFSRRPATDQANPCLENETENLPLLDEREQLFEPIPIQYPRHTSN